MRTVVVVVFLVSVVATGCGFDGAVPAGATVACVSDGDCPVDQKCLRERCRAREMQVPTIVDNVVTVGEDQERDIEITVVGWPSETSRLELVEAPRTGRLRCAFGVETCAEGCVDVSACTIEGQRVTYVPAPNESGEDAFVLRVVPIDVPELASEATTIPISIEPLPDPPEVISATASQQEVLQGETVTILIEAVDPDGDALFLSVVEAPNGSVAVDGVPMLVGDPVPAAVGVVTFTAGDQAFGETRLRFDLTDLQDAANPLAFRVPVSIDLQVLRGVKLFPLGAPVSIAEDSSAIIELSGQAESATGSPTSFLVQTQPANGTATISGNELRYVPALHFNGTDCLSVAGAWEGELSAPLTICVEVTPVNDPPTCVDCESALLVTEDVPAVFDLSARFSDVEGDPLSCHVVFAPLLGAAVVSGTTLNFTPLPNANGADVVTVRCDDLVVGDGAEGALQIEIAPVPDVARVLSGVLVEGVSTQTDTLTLEEDTEVFFLVEGEDVDGDPVTFEWLDEFGAPQAGGAILAHGRVEEILNDSNVSVAIYTPNPDEFGDALDVIRVRAAGESTAMSLTVNVTPVNDVPTFAPQAQEIWLHGSTITDIPLFVVDADPDDTIEVTILQQPLGLTPQGWVQIGFAQPITDEVGDHFVRFVHAKDFIKASMLVSITDGFSEPVQRSIGVTGLGTRSCAYIRNMTSLESGVRLLDPGEPGDQFGEQPRYFAHCEMDSGGGGWTLALRVLGGDQELSFFDGRWTLGRLGTAVDPDVAFSTGLLGSYGQVPVDELMIGFQTSFDTELRIVGATLQTPQPSLRAAFEVDAKEPAQIPLQTITGPTLTAREQWLRAVNAEDTDLPPGCNEVALRRRSAALMSVRIGLLAGADDNCADATGYAGIGGYLPPSLDGGPDEKVTAGGDARDGQFVSGAWGVLWVRSSDFTELPPRDSCAAHIGAGAKLNGRYRVASVVDAGADGGGVVDGGLVEVDCDAGSASVSTCRNGVVEPPEQCDDGNGVNGDGVNDFCDVNCTGSHCGNGIIGYDQNGTAETCDPPDGTSCDSSCQLIGGSS